MTATLIWSGISIPVALAVGRMLAGAAGGNSPGPPAVIRQPARDDLVRS